MSRRGGFSGSRGSMRRSKWEQEMAKEDATKSLLHNRFLEGLSGEDETSNNVASKLNESVEKDVKRDIKKEPLTEINLNQKAESKLDELMIEDTMVMDRIHVLQQSLEELTITAKSRASSAGQVGTAFEPQDRLFLRHVQEIKNQIDQLYHQERRRYKDASYGSFEKSRRFALLSGLTTVHDTMDKLIHEQHRMLREEYSLHEGQIDLICSTLADKTDEASVAAHACLSKIKRDMFKPYKP